MTNLLRWLSVACAVFAVCSAQAADDPAAATLRSAKILVENKEYDGARQLLQPVVQKGQPSAEAVYLLAACEEKLGNKQPALEGYKRALGIIESNPGQSTDELKDMATAAVDRLDAARQVLLRFAKQLEEEAAKLQDDNPAAAAAIRMAAKRLTAPAETVAEIPPSRRHPEDAVPFKGHWYKVFEGHVSWHTAVERCEAMGGQLVCVESAAEAEFLRTLRPGKNLWLGGSDQWEEGKWRWINGRPMSYTNWLPGEPSNSNGVEDHLVLLGGFDPQGRWDDWAPKDARNQGFICEWEK